MKIDERYLKFPKTLANDLESFMVFYPNKFPGIVSYYEEVAQKITTDPPAFREYGDWARDELFAGFEKIKADYDKGDQEDLGFLVSIDQRFHKLVCFRFWIVNYLFPDGPVHDYFVDSLKNLIRKFIDVADEVEEFESKVVQIQRDLLQSDYADLYLRQALAGVDIMKLVKEDPGTNILVEKATTLIDKHSNDLAQEINLIWDKFVSIVEKGENPTLKKIKEKIDIPLLQAKMRKTMQPVYNMLTHTVEFRVENEELAKRHSQMESKIDLLREQAKERLSPDEFEIFEVSYQQARNFTMYKDVMGEIDPKLLPVWFSLLKKVENILAKSTDIESKPMGHSGMFYHLSWYLPADLKAKVMSVDKTPFSLETL